MTESEAAIPRFEALPTPPVDLKRRSRIRFLHPGYPTGINTLLTLPRVDPVAAVDTTATAVTTTFGVHHQTALVACQIVAGNAFNAGRLTLDTAGLQVVNVLLDGILTAEVYYFVIDGSPDPYPIVPSFQDWDFPHGRVPDPWSPAAPLTSSDLIPRCVITNFSIALEQAHLVPKEEVQWYRNNEMDRYGSGILGNIDNPRNLVNLRVDMHRCFDRRWFTFVPKVTQAGVAPSSQFVTHILMDDAAELWPTYHNVLVPSLSPESFPYLFAHFAWAILVRVKPFVTRGFSRRVIQARVNDGKVDYETEMLSGSQLMSLYSSGGSKASTPRKRKRAEEGSTGVEDDDKLSSEESDVDMDDLWDKTDVSGEKQKQGRRRWLQRSSETTADIEDDEEALSEELKTRLEVLARDGEYVSEE